MKESFKKKLATSRLTWVGLLERMGDKKNIGRGQMPGNRRGKGGEKTENAMG